MTNRRAAGWFWLAVGLLCCTASAAAQERVAFEAAVRTGIGIPLGQVSGEAGDLNDLASLQIPLQLDVGVRLSSNWFLGAYVQYGFGIVSDDGLCDDDDLLDIDCSASDVRLGIQAHYHFSPRKSLDPWVGLGFGYEWATLNAEGGNVEVSWMVSGFEFVSFQFGLDIAVASHLRLGPFLSFSLAQFSDASVECEGTNLCGGVFSEIADEELHEWLMLGVRLLYGP